MQRITKMITATCLAFLITLISLQITHGLSLEITITTDKESYNLGENVLLTGNLTLDGSPVSDGLVSIQIEDPKDEHFVIRTLPTGPDIPGPWPLEILAVIPISTEGMSQYTFQRGTYVGFNVTIRNGMMDRNVIITVNTYYSDGVPFAAMEFTRITPIYANQTRSYAFPDLIEISLNAPIGTATVYVNAFTWPNWPKDGGFAYCPEKSADFDIVSGGSSSTANSTSTPGSFDTTFRIPGMYGKLGNYTVYAISRYSLYTITSQLTFGVELITDITGKYGVPDGKVDIRDVAMVARAFGANHVTDPASPKYCQYWHHIPCVLCPHDPICDLTGPQDVPDGKVDIRDVAMVAKDFGKIGIP